MIQNGENYIRFDWAMKRLSVDSLSIHDKQAYYRKMKSLFESIRDEGYQEGLYLGMAKEFEIGFEIGYEIGIEIGREERTMEIARQMKAMGLTDEQIALATGLSKEKIIHC